MLKKYSNNYLLFLGIFIFFCALILYNIYPEENWIRESKTILDIDNFFFVLVLAVIFAPIWEELVFRGYFKKWKYFKFIFYIGAAAIMLLSQNYYLLPLLLVFAGVEYFIKNKNKKNFLYIINSLIFALIHYHLNDFYFFSTIIPVFFQFSIGLILIWIAINFTLIHSMIAHSIWNGIIILPLFLLLQYPEDTKEYSFTDENYTLKWRQTPVLNNTNLVYFNDKVEGNNLSIAKFLQLLGKENIVVNDSLELHRYNFEVINNDKEKLEFDEVEQLMKKANLIENK